MNLHSSENKVFEDLSAATAVRIRRNLPGSKFTTMAVGGTLAAVAEPESEEEVSRLLQYASELGVPYRILGAGSNLLIPDSGVQALVIRLGRGLRGYTDLGQGVFRVSGAMSLMTLSRELSALGYSGLEFAGGIPALLGGAVCMNAGAHGGEMSDVLKSVTCLLPGGERCEFSVQELNCRYRHTTLPEGALIISADLNLTQSDPETTAKVRQQHLAERKKRQPLTQPSCGSVFKNPSPDRAAGWYIEQAGLKGASEGGAQVSTMHANWIVNPTRTATAVQVVSLVERCQRTVQEIHGVMLEPEMVRW